MNPLGWLRLWCGLGGPVDRRTFVTSGIGLALFKYAVEAGVIGGVTGRLLTPLAFISPSFAARADLLDGAPEWLGWALFVWSVPFIWIALSMSVRRAAAAGRSPWLGVAVLVPTVNLLVMALLAGLPDRPAEPVAPAPRPTPPEAITDPAAIRASLAAVAVGFLTFIAGIYLFKSYGAVLFFGTPLVMGMVAGFLYNRPVSHSTGATAGLGVLVMIMAGGVLLVFAFEGLICLAMAVPIVMPTAIAGTLLGKWIAEATTAGLTQLVSVIVALPLLAGAESLVTTLPEHEVLTVVEVDAPPEVVWRHVVEFPDLPEPTEWFFRCGIACPQRARIEGRGVGAIRHCEFTTGDFVEPITAWEEPMRLAFDVASQPDPMTELSPWRHVHPPHLHDQSLRSRRGEFRLVDLGGGRTRLEGRTWYTFDMRPQAYWTMWAHGSIHAIHRRVLGHVKQLAEREVTAVTVSSP
ncbi:MAG: SRPBCC family protein [Planctomycetota bacterium]